MTTNDFAFFISGIATFYLINSFVYLHRFIVTLKLINKRLDSYDKEMLEFLSEELDDSDTTLSDFLKRGNKNDS